MRYEILIIIALFSVVDTAFSGVGMATRRSGVATGQTPAQVKRRASGISVLEQKNIEERHDMYSGKDTDKDNYQQNNMRQNMRVGKANNPKPGEVYTVIENGVTVRKTYPMNPTAAQVEEQAMESVQQKANVSKPQTDAQKYANLTPWFRAKLLGEKVPDKPESNAAKEKKSISPKTKIKESKVDAKLDKSPSNNIDNAKK